MKNFRVYFENGEREDVLRLLQTYTDVVIDNIGTKSIGITIERDDADAFYMRILNKLDQEVFDFRSFHRF